MGITIREFIVGQTVFCYSFGSWYEGKVAKLGRTRLHVTYTTGSGKTRTNAFPLDKIALEKPEGRSGRQAAAAAKRDRRLEENKRAVGQPLMEMTDDGPVPIPNTSMQLDENGNLVAVETKPLQLIQMESLRLLSAFQALTMPTGFYRVTHKYARGVIAEMTGIHLKAKAKPPASREISEISPGNPLQGYVTWASDPSVQSKYEPIQEQTA